MGYGFVRYKRKADADRALKVLQMTVLDGKTLELKRSERTLTYVYNFTAYLAVLSFATLSINVFAYLNLQN